MASQWFYIIGKESHGPVSESQLEEIFLASMINRKTLVWNSKESSEWIPLEESDSLMERWGRRKLAKYGVGDVLYIRLEDGTIEKAKITKIQGSRMKVTFLIFGESFDEWIEMDSDRIQPTEFVPKSKSKSVMHPRKRKMKNRRAHGRTASGRISRHPTLEKEGVRLSRHPKRSVRAGFNDHFYSTPISPDFQEEMYFEIGEAKRDLRKRERRLEERERQLEAKRHRRKRQKPRRDSPVKSRSPVTNRKNSSVTVKVQGSSVNLKLRKDSSVSVGDMPWLDKERDVSKEREVQADFEADRMTLSKDLQSRIAELDKLKKELLDLEIENQELKDQNKRLDRQNVDKGIEIEQLRAQVHRMGSSETEMLHSLQKEKIQSLENDKTALQAQVVELEKQKEEFESQILSSAESFEALEEENERLNKELMELNVQKEKFLKTDIYSINVENESLKQKIEDGTRQFQAMQAKTDHLRESMKTLRDELGQLQIKYDLTVQDKRRVEKELSDTREKYMDAVRLAMSQEQHIHIGMDNMTPDLQRNRSMLLMGGDDDDSDDRTDIETLADKRELLRIQSGVDFDGISETEEVSVSTSWGGGPVEELTELTSMGEVNFVRFEDDEEPSIPGFHTNADFR